MSDPAWTDATRDLLHKRLGVAMELEFPLRVLAGWYHALCAAWWVYRREGDATGALLTKWRITAGKIGTDTDVNGMVYGTVTDENPGAGQAKVDLYSDSARSVLVATGSAANGAVVTLAAQANKFLAGQVTLGTITANFNFQLALVPPAYQRLSVVFDGTQPDDAKNMGFAEEVLEDVRNLLLQAAARAQELPANVMRTVISRFLKAQSVGKTMLDPGLDQDGTGEVTQEAEGLLEDHRLAQAANTGGSGVVKAGAPAHTATVAYPSGGWAGRETGPTMNTRAIPGIFTLTCEEELSAGSAPRFRVVFTPDDARRKEEGGIANLATEFLLYVGEPWKQPDLGIETFQVDYKPTVTNSVGTSLSTTTTDWSVTGLRSGNSDEGNLYTYYTTADTTLRFYKTSAGRDAQDADDVVALKVTSSTSTAFTTAENASGITIVGKTGAALANGDKGQVDFEVPTAVNPASYFTIDVDETTEASQWVKSIRDGAIGGAKWRPHTAATPNLEGGWILAGSPLGYLVIDGLLE